jgi:hypothetical protein
MKKLISVFVILSWLTPPARSQGQPGLGGGRVEVAKIQFITRRLNLTSAEAARFWPIYDAYSNEEKQVYQIYRKNGNELELEEAQLNLRKKYSVEFFKAIPPAKINDFFKAEHDFNLMIADILRKKQMMRGYPPPGP